MGGPEAGKRGLVPLREKSRTTAKSAELGKMEVGQSCRGKVRAKLICCEGENQDHRPAGLMAHFGLPPKQDELPNDLTIENVTMRGSATTL